MLRIEHRVYPVCLLEPTPGMHCPLASSLGMDIFSASLLLAQVLATKWLTWKLSCNLATVISDARDLNGGQQRLLHWDIISTYVWMIFEIQ